MAKCKRSKFRLIKGEKTDTEPDAPSFYPDYPVEWQGRVCHGCGEGIPARLPMEAITVTDFMFDKETHWHSLCHTARTHESFERGHAIGAMLVERMMTRMNEPSS